ncbi:hypothetical protein ACHAPU_009381 [Fusarium lateritium]
MPIEQELIDAANGNMILATSLDHALPREESMSSRIERWTVDSQSSSVLFKLPPELRLAIYELVFAEHDTYLDQHGKPLLSFAEPQWLLHELPEDTERPLPEHSSLKELDNIFYILPDVFVARQTRCNGLGEELGWLSPSVAPRRFQHTELLRTCRQVFIEARDTLMKNATLRAFHNSLGGCSWLQWPVTVLHTHFHTWPISGIKHMTRYAANRITSLELHIRTCHVDRSWFGIVTRREEWRCIKDLRITFSTEGLDAGWKNKARCLPDAFICMPRLNRVTFHFEGLAERFHVLREMAKMAQSQWKFQLGGKMKGYCLEAQGSIKVYSWRGLCNTDDSFGADTPEGWSTVNIPVGTMGGFSRAEYADAIVECRDRYKRSGVSINRPFSDLDDEQYTPFDERIMLYGLGLGQVMYTFSVTFTARKNVPEDEDDDSDIPGPGEVKESWPEVRRDVLVSKDGPDLPDVWCGPYYLKNEASPGAIRRYGPRT